MFRNLVFLLGFFNFWSTNTFAQTAASFDAAHADIYLQEAWQVSEKENGKLWAHKLYGPILFVNLENNAVIANQQDAKAVLQKHGDIFEGKLPADIAPSNSPIEWSGTRWTMLLWQYIPEDRLTRTKMFAHEMFHRIQPELKLAAEDSLNLQLDEAEGRVWLQLEWRALAAALVAQGSAQKQALGDALAFRKHRHKIFAGSAENESRLEIAEGVPEYTGLLAAATDTNSAKWYAVARLTDPDLSVSFVRSFAYTSGPAYGLLLDQRLPGWRKNLNEKSDLGKLLGSAIKGSEGEAEIRSAFYGASAIRVAEMDRASKIESTKIRYRKLLVDGPTLMLPTAQSTNYTFNPSTVISLSDLGAVYPTFHVTGVWGILKVTDGALRTKALSQVVVSAPTKTTGAHIEGPGWTLDLQNEWRIVPVANSKNFTVQKLFE